jgi:hypothetical protein
MEQIYILKVPLEEDLSISLSPAPKKAISSKVRP